MARFLFSAWSFAGHLAPLLSVATAVKARGHDVAFYTGPSVCSEVERAGIEAFPFQRLSEDLARAAVVTVDEAPLRRRSLKATARVQRAFRGWIAGTVPDQVADLRNVIDRWQPDVLVTDESMWGPILVLWESTGLPTALMSTLLGCLIPGPEAPPWGPGLPPPRNWRSRMLARSVTSVTNVLATGLRRELNGIRARHGLPPMRGSVNAFYARLPLYLIPGVPELDYHRRDLPRCVHYVGPLNRTKPSRGLTPWWPEGAAGPRPLVHVTEGSLHSQDPFVLRAAVHGLADRHMDVILTTGNHRDPDALGLGPLAANLKLERWVDHGTLLPRCSALVTTGGAGTILAALVAGVPMVIVPTRWDKPDNARRVVDAGVGISLPPRNCTPGRLRAAVDRVLNEPSFRRRAREFACRFAQDPPGEERAAKLLEGLTDRRTPPRLERSVAPADRDQEQLLTEEAMQRQLSWHNYVI